MQNARLITKYAREIRCDNIKRKPCCRMKPRDAAAVRCDLKFADIHYMFNSS